MYYTTPLIALTDQKLDELRQSAVRWGFSPDQIGLVTGNRRVNADAPVLVVVAEILLNRLLNPEVVRLCRSLVGGDGRVSFVQRSRTGHRLGADPRAAAGPRAHVAVERHGWQRDGIHVVAQPGSQPTFAIGGRDRAQGSAAIRVGRR